MLNCLKDLHSCQACPLSITRHQTVPGNGDRHASIMLIGESPGEEEDLEGKPFVGRAGKMLTALLDLAGISRDVIYITNLLKCWPPGNAKQKIEVKQKCAELWLLKEIEEVNPDHIILAGGEVLSLFFPKQKITVVNGTREGRFIKLLHPASILHNPNLAKMCEDGYKKLPQLLYGDIVEINDYRITTIPLDAIDVVVVPDATMLSVVLPGDKSIPIALDIETESLEDRRIVGVGICSRGGVPLFIKMVGYDKEDVHNILLEVARTLEGRAVVGHNWKYDLSIFHNYGVRLEDYAFLVDSMIAAYLCDEQELGLKHLSKLRLHRRIPEMSDFIDLKQMKGKPATKKREAIPPKGMSELAPIEMIAKYCGSDVLATLGLWEYYRHIMEERGLEYVFYCIEMPLVPAVVDMEIAGVPIDLDLARKMGEEIEAELDGVVASIYTIVGHEFNIASTKQLRGVLFDELKIDATGKMTKSGERSTDEEVIDSIRDDHPIKKPLLRFRKLTKRLSTYIQPHLDKSSSRVYPSFNQVAKDEKEMAAPRSGRLSSSNPNMQNLER